jgi:hypothetical protein
MYHTLHHRKSGVLLVTPGIQRETLRKVVPPTGIAKTAGSRINACLDGGIKPKIPTKIPIRSVDETTEKAE